MQAGRDFLIYCDDAEGLIQIDPFLAAGEPVDALAAAW